MLALKVSTQGLAERYVGFAQNAEQRAILASQNAAINAYGAQRANGEVDWSTFLRDPLAQAVRVESERAFHWQEGRYSLELRFSIVSGGSHVERFEFNLTRDNVEHLGANLSRWGDNLSAVISGGPWLTWNSVYPTLARS